VRIGLLGCGTVGGGVVRLLHDNAAYLASRVGAPLEVGRVLVRDVEKDRVPELAPSLLTTRAEDVLGDPSIELIVEVMGGLDPARAYVEQAMASGRGVVTANKMLLAEAGPALVDLAGKHGVDLAFEASVGGGIPIIRVLREAFAGDWVTSLSGIVNGTCNFILTRMQKDGLAFDTALREAQAKGYAEADPALDVDGHDAAHKLVVLAMLAFGARVDARRVPTEGVAQVEATDHAFASRFGYVIKHLAIGRDHDESIELRVHPALIPKDATLANVGGVLNAIAIEGRAVGPCLLSGRGAGDMPTAVSVVGDLLDVARAKLNGTAGLQTRGIQLAARELRPMDEVVTRYYLRFQVKDRPGVLGRIASTLGASGVSIEQMVQEGRGDEGGSPVQVVILTHTAKERDVQWALGEVGKQDFVAKPTRLLRIESG
jgi:homoserine dehydrogenase